jgi:hypothetical protein
VYVVLVVRYKGRIALGIQCRDEVHVDMMAKIPSTDLTLHQSLRLREDKCICHDPCV